VKAFPHIRCVSVAIVMSTQLLWGQVTVAVSPANQIVAMAQQFALDVTIRGVNNLGAATVRLVYDHTILMYISISQGPSLTDAFVSIPRVAPGVLYDTLTASLAILGSDGVSGSRTLLTLGFTAKAVGTTPITLSSVDLRSTANTHILCSTVNGQVTVDQPILIPLASFIGRITPENHPILIWTTLSETDNYGFMIQRKLTSDVAFADIQGSFVAGHGTTMEPREYSYIDASAGAGEWYYRLNQIGLDGAIYYSDSLQLSVVVGVRAQPMPAAFRLEQNFPNPFNPTTAIRFALPQASHVIVAVVDRLGLRVATLVDGELDAGLHTVQFDGTGLASGVYFYRMRAGSFTDTKKLLLIR
jgi:hypothetical protein